MNLLVYIFVANGPFVQIVLLQYALQRWKLALSITWAKIFEAPIFSVVVLIYTLSNSNLLPCQTQVKDITWNKNINRWKSEAKTHRKNREKKQ